MMDIHMVEGMDMVEERPEVEGMDTEEEDPSKKRSEVEGMDMEDMMVEVVEREHKSVVLVRHWIDDGVEMQ
jgi:hypothetical protein